MLTAAQRDLLAFIQSYAEAHRGVPPTWAEMAAASGLRSKSGVTRLICGLEERGYIRRLPNRARAIEILRPAGAEPLLTVTREPNGDVGLQAGPGLGAAVATDPTLRVRIYGCVDAALRPAAGKAVA